jgi:hypothetical protein
MKHRSISIRIRSEEFGTRSMLILKENYKANKDKGNKDKGNKDKATPLQAWTDPEDSRRLRLLDLKTIVT